MAYEENEILCFLRELIFMFWCIWLDLVDMVRV